MPILVIITPDIPADSKDKFLGAWPTIKDELSKQPGVLGVAGGQVVNESGVPVTDFKFVQTMTFASLEDEKAFSESAWAKEQQAKYKEHISSEPRIKKFQTSDIPAEKPKNFTQFSFVDIADESKHEEAKNAWMNLVAALGQTIHFGGKSVGDGPSTGLGVLGWDSEDEAKAAFTTPEAQAALQKYQSYGKGVGVMVKLQV